MFQDVFKFTRAVNVIKFLENLTVQSIGNLIFKLDVVQYRILRYITILRLAVQSCPLLRRLCKTLFDEKHLEKGLHRGWTFGKSALSGQYRMLP